MNFEILFSISAKCMQSHANMTMYGLNIAHSSERHVLDSEKTMYINWLIWIWCLHLIDFKDLKYFPPPIWKVLHSILIRYLICKITTECISSELSQILYKLSIYADSIP